MIYVRDLARATSAAPPFPSHPGAAEGLGFVEAAGMIAAAIPAFASTFGLNRGQNQTLKVQRQGIDAQREIAELQARGETTRTAALSETVTTVVKVVAPALLGAAVVFGVARVLSSVFSGGDR